jgi:flagellar motor switch protein FliM
MFEISIGNFQGDMCLCLPYLLVKPVLSRLSGQRWIGNDKKKTHVSHRQELAKRLNTTTVPCIARLGVSSMTVSDLAELEVGQVLPMQVCSTGEESSSKPKGRLGRVDLMVGDQIKFRGRTGLLGRNLAVQIEQVVAPISELIAHRDQSNLTIGEKK